MKVLFFNIHIVYIVLKNYPSKNLYYLCISRGKLRKSMTMV